MHCVYLFIFCRLDRLPVKPWKNNLSEVDIFHSFHLSFFQKKRIPWLEGFIKITNTLTDRSGRCQTVSVCPAGSGHVGRKGQNRGNVRGQDPVDRCCGGSAPDIGDVRWHPGDVRRHRWFQMTSVIVFILSDGRLRRLRTKRGYVCLQFHDTAIII